MILAPLALVLLATTPPETVRLLQKQSPAQAVIVMPRVSLRDAAIDAARRSGPRLEQAPPLRGGPNTLRGVRPGRKALAIGLGVLAGFVGGISIGYATSGGECPPPPWLWMSTTAGGGAFGWLVTR
jgi:hypothetical protein